MLYKLGIYFKEANSAESVPPYNLHLIHLPSSFVAGPECPMQPSDSNSHDQPGHQEYNCKLDSCNGFETSQQHSPLWQSCFKLLSWSASCTLRCKADGITQSDSNLPVVTYMQFRPQGLLHANVPEVVKHTENDAYLRIIEWPSSLNDLKLIKQDHRSLLAHFCRK